MFGFLWDVFLFAVGWYIGTHWDALKAKYLKASSSEGGSARRIDDR